MEQRFAFVVLPDGRAIYADVLRLVGPHVPREIRLGMLGVLNDTNWIYHDGRRTLHFGDKDEAHVFEAAQANEFPPLRASSKWYNLDELGIVCLKTRGRQVYDPHPTKGARARLEQMFCLNEVGPQDMQAAPEPFAQTVLVFYPNQPPEQTRRVADACKLEEGVDPDHFSVVLEDGKKLAIDLQSLEVSIP